MRCRTMSGRLSLRLPFFSAGKGRTSPVREIPDKYPPPKAPTILIPEAPTVSETDLEVDAFLQIPAARDF